MSAFLELRLDRADFGILHPLLQQGVWLQAPAGISVQDFLQRHLGLDAHYIDQRISTIFLNSRPVDNTLNAHILQDSVLALSGAMPGLVGATMRRGGHLAAFRSGIAWQESLLECHGATADLRLKLFNLLLDEVGPRLMQAGVLVEPERLRSLLETSCPVFHSGIFCPGDRMLDPAELMQPSEWLSTDEPRVRLQVVCEEESA